MANVNLQGSIVVLNLYDIADEIKLSDLPSLIGGTRLLPTFKHPAPEHVRFERPPVIEPLAPLYLATGEKFEATLQYYDYGVVSLLLRFTFSGTWEELQQLAGNWISGATFDDLCRNTIREELKRISVALVKPYNNWLSEDYYVIHLHSVPGISTGSALLQEYGNEISQIVRGDVAPLAAQERAEVLQGCMSYYQNDLIVAGWNAAFLFDTPTGAEPTIRLLEYANSQLLQFRHYDDMLTRELERVYDFVESRKGLLYGWRMRSAAARLRTMLLDVSELTERTSNALKFVGDMFFARVYKLCAIKIGATDYQALVQEKLRTADELYDFMIEQFHQARGFLLEFIVVLILMIELFFLFHGKSA
ncbi:MAG TPA: hypothetical protein VH724_13135 [Candidatus Angelobacter sp.]|jgi:hypothetical protein|nr:hypothetical protein [Candidatus Angelobacter sp.]